MSYARYGSTGHYIWCDGDSVHFDIAQVSDEEIDIFLYKICLTRPDEFKERVLHGRELVSDWMNKMKDINEDLSEYKECLLKKENKNKLYKNLIQEG